MRLLHATVAFLVGATPTDNSTELIFSRYIADYVYALPTIAFFMSSIGIFIIGRFITSQVLGYRRFRGPQTWQKLIALVRYLSYRGFHVKSLRWNSAPIGVLLLGAAGTIYFFCESVAPRPDSTNIARHGLDPAAVLLV